MEFQDHAYTSATCDKVNPVEFTYKMTPKETEEFVKLRMSNNVLFSGRRNAAMRAWRAILKHMGMQHKMTYNQASRKWENMKKRYKELKYPPEGVVPGTWRHFTLMNDAMEGRLEGMAPILKASSDDTDSDFLPISKPKKRRVSTVMSSPTALLAGEPEVEVSLNGDWEVGEETVQEGNLEIDRIMQEAEDERNMMDSERQVIEREKRMMERERLVLHRERAVLDREVATLERDRASLERERTMIEREKVALERERAMIEREKAVLEKERAVVEKDRHTVSRDLLALEREKAWLGRLSAPKERTEEVMKDDSNVKDSDIVARKERFLNLFEKLIENF